MTREVEIVPGRDGPPWTQVPDWVILSGVPATSIAAYAVLRMHLNRCTGQLNPGTVRLAALLGLPRSDRVAGVIRPLVEIGAVEVHAYGMPRRNRYVVHSVPPEGYQGPVTLGQWSAIHEDELGRRRRRHAEAVSRSRTAGERRLASVDGGLPVAPISGSQDGTDIGSPVAPISGLQVAPPGGLHVAPKSGPEPDEGEPDEGKPPSPPAVDASTPAVADLRGEGGEPADGPPVPAHMDQTARDVLRRVTTGLPARRLPSPRQVESLVSMVAATLRSGWTVQDLTDGIGGDLTDATSIHAVLRHRLGNLGDAPPPRSSARVDSGSRAHTMSQSGDWRLPRDPATAASQPARDRARREAVDSARRFQESQARWRGRDPIV